MQAIVINQVDVDVYANSGLLSYSYVITRLRFMVIINLLQSICKGWTLSVFADYLLLSWSAAPWGFSGSTSKNGEGSQCRTLIYSQCDLGLVQLVCGLRVVI